MHRLFVALRPPPDIRRQLLAAIGGIPEARWQDDEQLHVTLRFIGEVERRVAEDVAVALGSVGAPAPTIQLKGSGTFDRRGIVHTLWAGVEGDTALDVLRARIERALGTVGIAPAARAFRPHVTLARLRHDVAEVGPFVTRTGTLSSMPVRMDAFLLYESHLSGAGAHYETIARYPLR